MKIRSIIGARPQFIKSVPLFRATRKEHKEILVSGQHYDSELSEFFFKELNIPEPYYNSGIGFGSHREQTAGKIQIGIEKILINEKPDLVLVYGDINSTLAGMLAASKLHIKTAHIECVLRSFDRDMPEEVNRVLTDHISDFLFCPTETAVLNLKNEGVTTGVYNVGDVMLDALEYNLKIAKKKAIVLVDLDISSNESLVVTAHRDSNIDNFEKLSSIINALCEVNIPIVFSVHPRTVKYLKQYGLWVGLYKKANVIYPAGYLEMLELIAYAKRSSQTQAGCRKKRICLGCSA